MGKLTTPKYPYSPIDLDTQTVKFIDSLEDRLNRIDAMRIDDNSIYFLGYNWQTESYSEIIKHRLSRQESDFSFKNIDVFSTVLAKFCTLGIYAFTKGVRNRKKQREMYYQKMNQYKEANEEEGNDKLKHVTIYQGDITEAEKELGPLERVDTGSADRFLKKNNILNLRIRAYQLGADAIIHYMETSGSCIGTPVKKKY